jgi:hypothetical protein
VIHLVPPFGVVGLLANTAKGHGRLLNFYRTVMKFY